MSIKDRLDEEPESAEGWIPASGDELIGTITRINDRTTDNGTYPVVTIQKPDGERLAFHAYHTVAKGQLEEQNPQVGDEIGVRYLGQTKGAVNSYYNYRIVVEHSARSDAEAESIAATQAAEEAEKEKRDESIPF